jgi:hypothetical protein
MGSRASAGLVALFAAMIRCRLWIVMLLALAPAARADVVKLSLPTEDVATAWRRPGLRLQIGAGYGEFAGLDGAPSGRLIAAIVRIGMRLDADWSLLASFQYASASARGGLSGIRFSGTLDPVWHVTNRVELAVGFGFGGIVEGNTGRTDPNAMQRSGLNDSLTYPTASPPLPSCSGVGVATHGRATWMRPLGPISATGFALEVGAQWTGCVDNTGRVEPDTAQPIVRRQWWPHVGGTLEWLVTWR